MKFSDQRIRKLVNSYPDNTTRAMSSIALDYDIPYNRVYRAVHKKIPLRTARAMVRAGLPLSRSELRGNPFGIPVLSPYQNELLRLKRADARGYAFTKKFSSKQPQALDMLISKLSMLKGNRDEMLVTFLIRKRPKHSRDYIVILKHRKYVDGARVYSAGQKAEGAIGQFATILGAKAKRVGQSDYVFTTYGIRFPEERKKSRPGKLFPNAKSFPNIEKSKFNKGRYVGYSPKAVNVFSIARGVGYRGWRAIGQIYKTIGAGHQQGYPGVTTKIIYGKDLAQISKALENL